MTISAGVPEPAEVELPVTRGDPIEATFQIEYTDANGAPTGTYPDFTDAEGKCQIREDTESTVVLVELTVSFTDDPTHGVFTVRTDSEDGHETQDLLMGVAHWDVEITPAGGRKRTWMGGDVPITPDTSRIDV